MKLPSRQLRILSIERSRLEIVSWKPFVHNQAV